MGFFHTILGSQQSRNFTRCSARTIHLEALDLVGRETLSFCCAGGGWVMINKTLLVLVLPIPSMYGICNYIYHKDQPNVGKYTSPMDGMG